MIIPISDSRNLCYLCYLKLSPCRRRTHHTQGNLALDGHFLKGSNLILLIRCPQNLAHLTMQHLCQMNETVSERVELWRWSLHFHQSFPEVMKLVAVELEVNKKFRVLVRWAVQDYGVLVTGLVLGEFQAAAWKECADRPASPCGSHREHWSLSIWHESEGPQEGHLFPLTRDPFPDGKHHPLPFKVQMFLILLR